MTPFDQLLSRYRPFALWWLIVTCIAWAVWQYDTGHLTAWP